MQSLSYKSKQYLWALLKVVILAFVSWFIIKRLYKIDFYTYEHFINRTLFDLQESKWILLSCLGLSIFNWVFEIFKWQQLVKKSSIISFKQAYIESFAGSTLTFITPAKIGEYGIKASYYPAKHRIQIVLANFIGNGVQLCVTIFFGIIACAFYLLFEDFKDINRLIYITLCLGLCATIALYLLRNKKIIKTGISLHSVFQYTKSMDKSVKTNVIILSFVRYLSFSLSFSLLLWLFGGGINYQAAIIPIFAMYFFSSLLPSFFVIDLALKGGIAMYLFSFYDVAPIPVACAALSMWILNFALPAVIGSYYVLTYKTLKA